MTDADHEMLHTIERRLLKLNEDRLLGEISQTNYAFGMYDAPVRGDTRGELQSSLT